MKKKILSILFMTCFVIFSFFGLTACDSGNKNNENSPKELSAPVVSLVGSTASWSADSNADKFEISLDGSLSYVENTITSKTLTSGQTLKVIIDILLKNNVKKENIEALILSKTPDFVEL